MSPRTLKVFFCDVEKLSSAEFYVAAESDAEARSIAEWVAETEMEWDCYEYVASAREQEDPLAIPQRALDELGGIWVQDRRADGKRVHGGGWMKYADELPELPPLPDPNQLSLLSMNLESLTP